MIYKRCGATINPSPRRSGNGRAGCRLRKVQNESADLRTLMYQAVTRNIEVTVSPRFLPERSSIEKSYYFWAYTVEISNRGKTTVQLKTRHWRITDGFGRLQEVRGPGVVGEEPVLEPGATFEYTSGVPLPTPSGFMVGTYGMVSADGEHFDIAIPAFSLDGPEAKRTIN
jgi:ApaG protein